MASKNAGISGMAIAAASFGGILVYAGFRGISPLQALRDIGSGKPPGVASNPVDLTVTEVGENVGTILSGVGGAVVVAAAQKYKGDQYSQAKRTQDGWSDCSSFCDKAFRDAGIPPPVKWAATANYRMSPDWKTIPRTQAKPGDIAISGGHMVLVTAAGGTAAIGQQNPRVDVRTGSVADLMSGQSYVYKTYVGKAKPKAAAPVSGITGGVDGLRPDQRRGIGR